MREVRILAGHKVVGLDGAKCNGIVIGTSVAHNADGAAIGEHRKILIGLLAKMSDLLTEDIVRLAQDIELFTCDLSDHADRKTGTREGLTSVKLTRKSEHSADLTNLIAIAEMTPGSLGVNAATFAGTKTAGMPGGVFAVLGVLSPTLTLTLLAAAFFQKFRTSRVMSYIMKIVKPVCIGMVLGVLVGLCRQTCITEAGGISLPGIAIGILCFVLLQKFKLSVPKVIGIAAVLGLVCFGVF